MALFAARLIHALREGVTARLNGYWRSWSSADTVFEFAAHYLAIGEGARIP
jgi:hypothetical protein